LAGARIQLFVRGAGGVEWRLMAPNNRELGRGGGPFPSADACLEALRRMQVPPEPPSFVLARDFTGVLWRWELVYPAASAVSSRSYQRRLACLQAATRFADLFQTADRSDTTVHDFHLANPSIRRRIERI